MDPLPKALASPAAVLTHLERLEAESIQIMREVVAECERPVMLYSIGKDSAVMPLERPDTPCYARCVGYECDARHVAREACPCDRRRRDPRAGRGW